MKIKHLLTKTLLVAAGLLVGANSAWARTITYDFSSAVGNGGITASTLTKGTSAGKNNSTDIFYPNELTSELQNRFAFQYREKSGKTNAWSVDKGRGGLWSNCASGVDDYFSIMNLKAGDVVTITFTSGEIFFSTVANATYDNSGSPETPAQWASLISGKEYTIIADGKLDLQAKKFQSGTRGHLIISSIVIVTSDDELIETAPSVNVTGANGGAREITITSYDTSLGNGTTAYYTLDGTTPTASSTEYSAAFNISAADDSDDDGIVVVKAISCKTGETSIASSVTTLNVPVGTSVPLNAPVINLTAFNANGGVFNPTYTFTSNQGSVIGAPTATLSYSFAGGASTAGTSYTPTTTGTLRVTASAEGYASTYTDLDVTCAEFLKTYVFDATSDITINDGAPTTYTNYSINSKGCNLYALSNCTFSTRKSISFDGNMQFAWAVTANEAYCLFARLNNSTVSYSLNDGEYIEFTSFGSPIIASSATSSTSLAWYSSVRQINVYTPSVSVEVSAAGYATYVNNNYDLDFSTSDIKAYKVKVTDKAVATMTQVDNVPANTPVLLYKDGGATENIPVMTGAAAVSENDLVAGTGATVPTEDGAGNTNMILNNVGGNVGFYLAADQIVASNRAYLHFDSSLVPDPSAPMMMVFDGEATGIADVRGKMEDVRSDFFDLQGRKVAQPAKGLYIVNGKKVVIK